MQEFLDSRKPILICRDKTGGKARIVSNPNTTVAPIKQPTPFQTNEWLSNDYLLDDSFDTIPIGGNKRSDIEKSGGYLTMGRLSSEQNIMTGDLAFESYLKRSKKPPPSNNEDCISIAPLNTNINFNALHRKPFRMEGFTEHYDNDTETAENANYSKKDFIVPPLNTDIRFSAILPYRPPSMSIASAAFEEIHPHRPHTHVHNAENFSWGIITPEDSPEIVAKKKLIHPIQNQRLCGSCFAVSTAAAVSDCFVVSGLVDWSPRISPTFMMTCFPVKPELQQQCKGGNPAELALELEKTGVADTSCLDYSWCSNDSELCTSASASHHFDNQDAFSDALNNNIPKPCGCYFPGKKYLYRIDKGTDVCSVGSEGSVENFRKEIIAHILDYGPSIGGFAVLTNFVTGNCTDININGGVYFDRANYSDVAPGKALEFDDGYTTQIVGLHAVSIIGWGIAKNIQYDTNKYGDVPFWHCRNSWGQNWGNSGGYFRIAMYPFNKVAQFCSQVDLPQGSVLGSMILIRAAWFPPDVVDLGQISDSYLQKIKKIHPDSYYKQLPDAVRHTFSTSEQDNEGFTGLPSKLYILIGLGVIVIIVIYLTKRRS